MSPFKGNDTILINVNGQILNAEQAKISVFDRGFLYGDSLYEVARTYAGQLFHLDDHLVRLEKSAELCRMVLSQNQDVFRKEILRTLEAFRKESTSEAYVRIIVTRGVGKIGFGLSCVETPTQFIVIVQPVEPPSTAKFNAGLSLDISHRLRNHPQALDPAMKSGNYLNSLLAFLEAQSMDFDDALLCNSDGHVTEGTTFNVFYARRGILATPPLEIGILDGITRREIIKIASKIGIEVREVRFPPERLFEADEVFVTSSIKEVFPVTRIGETRINSGKPGPLTLKLASAFKELTK